MPIIHHPLLAIWGLTSTTWLILWCVLAALTILLLVLLRTKWSKARPWRKCGILSLWVHVLLACAATTVCIVTGAPELGNESPIRVAVVTASAETEETELEEEITPDWELSAEPPLVAPEVEPLEAPALEPLEAPQLEPLDAAAPSSEVEPLPTPALSEQPLAKASEPVPDSVAENNEQPPNGEPIPARASAVDAPTPFEPDVPETYSDRFAKDRTELAEKRGGSAQTERAVRAALGWLASVQSDNGGWDASKFGAGKEHRVLGEDRHHAGMNADTGVTGLALLSFLGSGHTHLGGAYAKDVAGGLEYLRRSQRSDGALYGAAQMFARMYCHSMATFAVCEAYALTDDERLAPMAEAAVRYTLSMQHPTDGGWRYRRGDTGDTSQLGWQLMALKSAELAGIEVPAVTWTRIERFLRKVQRGSAGGLAAYRPDGPASPTMTAEAMFCRQLLRGSEAYQLDAGTVREATQSIVEEFSSASQRNLYFWYYASLALHQNQLQSPESDRAWDDWNQRLTTALLTTQQDDGSWSAESLWGGYGGRVYTTALSALCLEVYYRYSPTEAPGELAGGRRWRSVRK